MDKIPGVLAVIDENGSENPFTSVVDVLPKTEAAPPVETNSSGDIKESTELETKIEGTNAGYLLANILKEKGIDIDGVDKSSDIDQVVSKLTKHIESQIETKAKELYGEDTITAAKMLNSGMSLEERTEYGRLQLLSNQQFISEDMDDRTKDLVTEDVKEVIKAYYEERLSGRALQKAIDGIDEFSDDFKEEFDMASNYFKDKKQTYDSTKLKEISDTKAQESTYLSNVEEIIKSGKISDFQLSKQEADALYRDVYEKTEDVEVNGEIKKMSLYNKNALEISRNPQLGAKLVALVRDINNLSSIKNIGKSDYLKELEGKLRGQSDNNVRAGAVVGGKTLIKGVQSVLDTQTY